MRTKTEEIEEAISTISFSMSSEWELYLYCLTNKEIEKENKKIIKAHKTLERYGLNEECAYKHMKRQSKYITYTKAEFTAINSEDLPF